LRVLHSFPTRRSSDLVGQIGPELGEPIDICILCVGEELHGVVFHGITVELRTVVEISAISHTARARRAEACAGGIFQVLLIRFRSEEHTSELQSPYDL